MKKIILALAAAAVVIFSGCSKRTGGVETARRTVLVYMAARNSLSDEAYANLSGMAQGYKDAGVSDSDNLIVYFDAIGENPKLVRVDSRGVHTLKTYPQRNSCTPEALAGVIGETLAMFPALDYGLVLWSHGTGWAPADFPLSSVSPRTANAPAGQSPYPPTRTFGQQYYEGTNYEIELSALKQSVPSGVFELILFDACYMGGVETAYALRDKAQYIISSPARVVADGMPYSLITGDLFPQGNAEASYKRICEKYFSFYNGYPDPSYRSATVSLVRTSGLAALAASVGNIVKKNASVVSSLPLAGMQYFDAYAEPFMFDLDQFMERTASADDYSVFSARLSQTVLYAAHTDDFFGEPITRCCGLSSYIPVAAYSRYNAYYVRTDWYDACYR